MNYIPAVILSGFGRRQHFILTLVSIEFSYFEGGCYCFLRVGVCVWGGELGRQESQTGFGVYMPTRSSWQLY